MKSDFDASSFRIRRLLAKSSQRTCLVHLLVYTLQLIVPVLLVKSYYTIAFELIFSESLTTKIRSMVSLSDAELKQVLTGATKFWREIERNFGHKRNRLGANAAREFEVSLI